ncbi:MAG: RHS repeat-associated core domain-containing protein, partial [Steroidobacteraceae bacterium]
DPAGNLTSRQDLRQGLAESFTYDALDRLTLAAGPGAQSTTLAYDAIGNLQSKTGVGSYTYHPTRRHAVTSAGGVSYGYDANGNMTSRGGATIGWSSYNLPTTINAPGGYSAQFAYAPDRSRWRQVSTYAGGTETTIYVGGLLEKLTTPARTHWKHLIATPSGQVQVIRRSDGTSETLYVTTDHLGSTDAVLDAAGNAVLQGSFAVHGERRAGNWQGPPSSGEWQSIANTTRRGYTGHEMLDNVALIHMNGRVLDPALGRFLSADPYIDGPLSTQGWNRYAYVHGRPLSASDPTGYGLCPPNAACLCYAYDNCNVLWTLDDEVVVPGKRIRGWTDPFLVVVDQVRDIIGLPNPEISSSEDGSGPGTMPAPAKPQDQEPNPCEGKAVSSKAERLKNGPDFVSISIPTPIPFIGVLVTIDRYGQSYVGPGFGAGYPAAGVSTGFVSDSPQLLTRDGYSGGDIQSRVPSASELRNFLSGVGATIGAGVGVGVNLPTSPSSGRTAGLLMTPGVGVSYSFDLPTGMCPP